MSTGSPQLSTTLVNFAAEDPGGWQFLLDRAKAADRAGIDRLVVSDHVCYGENLEAYSKPELGGSKGGGSSWAIPWAIVQCESGGQNFTPNYLGASGYYQFMPQTWRALGGSTPNAYQASKAEQDRLAAKLWNGGAGAGNWDCAAIVGISG